MSRRQQVLSLYRQILRHGRAPAKWEKPADAQRALLSVRAELAANRGAADDEAQQLLRAAEQRLEVALHYRLPYKRPDYLGGGGGEGPSKHREAPAVLTGLNRRVNVGGASRWLPAGSR